MFYLYILQKGWTPLTYNMIELIWASFNPSQQLEAFFLKLHV